MNQSSRNIDNQTDSLVTDETYWTGIRQQFRLDESYIDLRSNAASPLPSTVLDHFISEYTHIQEFPSYRNREIAAGEKEQLRASLATELNCSSGELAIMRSTTEALNNAIMGFPFQPGDEVIASSHEYDSMLGSCYQQQARSGIFVKQVHVPYSPESTEQIIDIFRKAITPKTKMFLVSHIVWISGQVYPVKEICALAKQHNIYTVIDAAQSFSHIPVDVKEMDCDYLGGALHKWAAAPLGTGFLYMKKKHIAATMPLLGHYLHKPNDEVIEKFENFGAYTPVFNSAALSLAHWRNMGSNLKTLRMQYLKEYWTAMLQTLTGITILTNAHATHSCGLAYFQVKNRSSRQLAKLLMNRHNISVQVIEQYKNEYVNYGDVNAIGIATPVFITPTQLDTLYNAVRALTA